MTDDELDFTADETDDEESLAARRYRKPRKIAPPLELEDSPALEEAFQTTYKPSRFEKGFLLTSLHAFYQQRQMRDILYRVKGGKEANVYCCQGDPLTGLDLIAAKVYRPREFRNLRNDKMYREGRPVLTADGRPVKPSDQRIMRALGKKTDFGMQVQHTSWLMYEYTTLECLHKAGAAVPQPFAAGDNAILMGFQGDRQRAASTLIEVSLERDEAETLFQEVLRNIELMLQHGFIHGDLSAYNILYWEGKITLIDFPQVTHVQTNSQAEFILQRDLTRVCEYFANQGVETDPAALHADYWSRYAPEEDPI